MNEQDDSLHLLGYDQRWLAYGFLTSEALTAQRETYTSSHDKNTEHYRYASFRRVLAQRSSLSGPELTQYIKLAELDPDPTMAGAALADLLVWRGLTEEQFEYLAAHEAYRADFLQRLVRRRRLVEAIRKGPVSAALVRTCLASRDGAVQEALVSSHGVRREHLEAIANDGCNRAVRNRARDRLHSRRQDPPN